MRNIFFSLAVSAFVFTGCTTGFWSDAAKQNHDDVYRAMFADSIRVNINSELKLQKAPGGETWREFWIHRCEQVYYSPGMGEKDVEYIVKQRRAAGLPDISEINHRQFRSEWKIFTDQVDKQIDQELNGASPPAMADGKIWVKNWPDYWMVMDNIALRNSSVSTNGVKYITEHRKEAGLSSSN
jgi:hypothetical protein